MVASLKLPLNILETSVKLQTDTSETPLQLPQNILLQMLRMLQTKKMTTADELSDIVTS